MRTKQASATARLGPGMLLAVLALSGALAAPPGLVICVAPGEHIAIETAIETVPCVDALELGFAAADAPVSEVCTDAPLLSAFLGAGANTGYEPPPPISQHVPRPWPPIAPNPREVLDARGGLEGLRAHRTVVLLV